MNVELRHLRAFIAVAQTANFTRALSSYSSPTVAELHDPTSSRLPRAEAVRPPTRATSSPRDGEQFSSGEGGDKRFDAADGTHRADGPR